MRDRQLMQSAYEKELCGTERRTYPDGNKLMLAVLSFQKRGFKIEVRAPLPHHSSYHYPGAYICNYELIIYFHLDEKGKRVP